MEEELKSVVLNLNKALGVYIGYRERIVGDVSVIEGKLEHLLQKRSKLESEFLERQKALEIALAGRKEEVERVIEEKIKAGTVKVEVEKNKISILSEEIEKLFREAKKILYLAKEGQDVKEQMAKV